VMTGLVEGAGVHRERPGKAERMRLDRCRHISVRSTHMRA
jgi:hypothetical protein